MPVLMFFNFLPLEVTKMEKPPPMTPHGTSKQTLRGPLVARRAAGLTQEQAAKVIGATRRAWQCWEGGQRNMPPAKLQLFEILTGQDK